MKKYTIPSVLVAIVLIAGIFAFMPINEASTVHTTIQNSQLQIKTATDTTATTGGAGNGNAADGATVLINPAAPFILLQFTVECSPGDDGTAITLCDAGEDMDMISYVVDSQTVVSTITAGAQAGDANDALAARVLSLYGFGADASDPEMGITGKLAAATQILFNLTNDTEATVDADDGFNLTSRVTILTAGTTAFGDAQITFTP